MFRDKRVAVVIPAHNEGRLIARTLGTVPAYVDAVIVVDDASTDDTRARIAEAAAGDRRVLFVAHADNRGVGASIVSGYRVALADGADIIAVMDGDGQMDPADLGALLEPVAVGRADFAKGYRFLGRRARGPMPLTRLVGNRALSLLTKLAAGYARPLDAQCGYTALTARAVAMLPLERLYPRYGFPNDLTIRALEAGLRLESVPVRAVYGAEVSGIRPHVAIPRILGLLAVAAARRLRFAPPRVLGAAGATERP